MSCSAIPSRIAVLIPSLGRTNDHEVVATAHAIGVALRSADLDWHDLAAAIRLDPSHPRGGRNQTAEISDQAKARWCSTYGNAAMTIKERQFVHDLAQRLSRFGGHATDRQRHWLDAIYLRLRRAAA